MRLFAAAVGGLCWALAAWLIVEPRSAQRLHKLRRPRSNPIIRVKVLTSIAARTGVGAASRRRQAAERARLLQALSALASELEAGQPPLAALATAAGEPPVWPLAVIAARQHGDAVAALRLDGHRHEPIAMLAACWEVGSGSGAGLASAVARLADSARVAEDVRVQLEAQLAGPRATARMLAALPLVGLALGSLLGAEPLRWIFGTPVGLTCLAAGIGLTILGMWWTNRIAAAVDARL